MTTKKGEAYDVLVEVLAERNSTTKTKVKDILKDNGITSTSSLMRKHISFRDLDVIVLEGLLDGLKPGLYKSEYGNTVRVEDGIAYDLDMGEEVPLSMVRLNEYLGEE